MTTTTNIVTNEDVFREVRRLAEERPDFVYEPNEDLFDGSGGCRYREADGTPGCIVGQALARLVPDFVPLEGIGAGVVVYRLTNQELTFNGGNWIATVQREQDKGVSWGDALADADRQWGRIGDAA